MELCFTGNFFFGNTRWAAKISRRTTGTLFSPAPLALLAPSHFSLSGRCRTTQPSRTRRRDRGPELLLEAYNREARERENRCRVLQQGELARDIRLIIRTSAVAERRGRREGLLGERLPAARQRCRQKRCVSGSVAAAARCPVGRGPGTLCGQHPQSMSMRTGCWRVCQSRV